MKTTALNEAQNYARRVDDEMDRLWDEGKWDHEKNEAILQEHLRTPYNHA